MEGPFGRGAGSAVLIDGLVFRVPAWLVVVANVVWFGAGSVIVGYLMHRVPAARFSRDSWLTRARAWERDGRVYDERLRIRRWKDRLPEGGAFFAGGFSKRAVAARDRAYFERFVVETRRAEVTHWWVLALAPVCVLWNPWWALPVVAVYALAANVPCILVQRYNRARLRRLVQRAS